MPLPHLDSPALVEDGNAVTLRASCQREGFRRIGLGEHQGIVLPAQWRITRLMLGTLGIP